MYSLKVWWPLHSDGVILCTGYITSTIFQSKDWCGKSAASSLPGQPDTQELRSITNDQHFFPLFFKIPPKIWLTTHVVRLPQPLCLKQTLVVYFISSYSCQQSFDLQNTLCAKIYSLIQKLPPIWLICKIFPLLNPLDDSPCEEGHHVLCMQHSFSTHYHFRLSKATQQ